MPRIGYSYQHEAQQALTSGEVPGWGRRAPSLEKQLDALERELPRDKSSPSSPSPSSPAPSSPAPSSPAPPSLSPSSSSPSSPRSPYSVGSPAPTLRRSRRASWAEAGRAALERERRAAAGVIYDNGRAWVAEGAVVPRLSRRPSLVDTFQTSVLRLTEMRSRRCAHEWRGTT